MVRQQVVQPAAIPHDSLPGDGVVLRYRRGLPIDVDLIGSSTKEQRRRAIRINLLDAVAITVIGESPGVATNCD